MKNMFFMLLLVAGCLAAPLSGLAQIVPAPTDKQLQAIDKVMAPLRKKVTDILLADKTGQYKIYQSDLAQIAKTRDPDAQQQLLAKLQENHYAFMKKAFNAAIINHEEMKREVARILGHNNFVMDEFGGFSSESFLPLGPLPLRFEKEMTCPFAVFENYVNQTLVANCSGFANDCKISTTAITEFDGGCRSQGWTGDKFELTAGTYSKINLHAQFDATGWGLAFALGGYAKSESKIGLRLKGPGVDKLVIVKDVWCVAPVIWFKQYEFNTVNFQAQAAFTGSFSGGSSFTAQVFNESHAIAVPALDGGASDCSSDTFDFIRVVASN